MTFTPEMQAALAADGEKLRAMTGEDHGPWDIANDGPFYGVDPPPAQAGGDEKLLMDIAILMHNWRCGRYKDVYVLSRLSQMFPDPPSVARRT